MLQMILQEELESKRGELDRLSSAVLPLDICMTRIHIYSSAVLLLIQLTALHFYPVQISTVKPLHNTIVLIFGQYTDRLDIAIPQNKRRLVCFNVQVDSSVDTFLVTSVPLYISDHLCAIGVSTVHAQCALCCVPCAECSV